MRAIRKFAIASIAAALVAGPLAAPAAENAGAYLAARKAYSEADFPAAARYFVQALFDDPANENLLEDAIISYLGAGEPDRAVVIARRLYALHEGKPIATTVLIANQVHKGDFEQAARLMAKLKEHSRDLTLGLSEAWVLAGQGRMSDALERFDAVADISGLEPVAHYHKALALALAGDYEGAEALLSKIDPQDVPPGHRLVLARLQALSRLERQADAADYLRTFISAESDPFYGDLLRRLEAGAPLPFDVIRSPSDGLAEAYLNLANLLNEGESNHYSLIYAQLAIWLRPDLSDARLLLGSLYDDLGQYEAAARAYEAVPPGDQAHMRAGLNRALSLMSAGRTDAALEGLQELAAAYPKSPLVFTTLGDGYRRTSRYAEAEQAYDKAIALYPSPDDVPWRLYYMRGIARERLGKWDQAEPDFRKALELNPDQPQVLNYLGYSLVERNTRLNEALDMIQRAVEARPRDGYIVDSLGWAYYRLGRYADALVQMERAVELSPLDPVLNDHLGDVYWANGRKREARVQWRRALSLDPEEKDAARIRLKLEKGLDAVLREEGAAPLRAANDN